MSLATEGRVRTTLKAVLSRAWYYVEPWVILPPQRPMPWQGLAIIIGPFVVLSLLGRLLAALF